MEYRKKKLTTKPTQNRYEKNVVAQKRQVKAKTKTKKNKKRTCEIQQQPKRKLTKKKKATKTNENLLDKIKLAP